MGLRGGYTYVNVGGFVMLNLEAIPDLGDSETTALLIAAQRWLMKRPAQLAVTVLEAPDGRRYNAWLTTWGLGQTFVRVEAFARDGDRWVESGGRSAGEDGDE